MKQYCRYCQNCIYGDVVYCEEFDKTMDISTAKRANNCKSFELNEIDALSGDMNKKYKPRVEKSFEDQPTLFD